MIKKIRKGFTLVELVVVIAVVAILAAVSVVTYVSITKKAKESHDQQIIDQMNLTLSAEAASGQKPETMHRALEVLAENGFAPDKFGNLHGEAIGYEFAYSLKENKFLILKAEASPTQIVYPSKVGTHKDYEIWKFAEGVSSSNLAGNFSYYLKGNDVAADSVTVKAGFDVGDNKGIKAITYNGNAIEEAKNVIIRTNNINGLLSVDAVADTVYHYNNIGSVSVIRTANNSYHEYGTAGFVKVASGRVVAEADGYIETVLLTEKGEGATLPAIIEIKSGATVTNKYATTQAVATANNNDDLERSFFIPSIQYDVDVVAGIIDLAGTKTASEITTLIGNIETAAKAKAFAPEGIAINNDNFPAVINTNTDKVHFYLEENIDISSTAYINHSNTIEGREIVIDLNGKSMTAVGNAFGGQAVIDYQSADVTFKNGTLVCNADQADYMLCSGNSTTRAIDVIFSGTCVDKIGAFEGEVHLDIRGGNLPEGGSISMGGGTLIFECAGTFNVNEPAFYHMFNPTTVSASSAYTCTPNGDYVDDGGNFISREYTITKN